MGALEGHVFSPAMRLALAIGFVGAYTTFSTWTYETLQLIENGSVVLAAANAAGNLAIGLMAALGGLLAGRGLWRTNAVISVRLGFSLLQVAVVMGCAPLMAGVIGRSASGGMRTSVMRSSMPPLGSGLAPKSSGPAVGVRHTAILPSTTVTASPPISDRPLSSSTRTWTRPSRSISVACVTVYSRPVRSRRP